MIDSSESNAVVDGLTIDNVLCSLQQYGFAVVNDESAAAVTITNSKFAANGNGLAVEHRGSLVGLTMTGGEISGNVYGFGVNAQNTVGYDNAGTFRNISITGTTVSGNSQEGLYFEKISDGSFSGITFSGNAGASMPAPAFSAAALKFNLKFDDYSAITVTDCTFSDNGGSRPVDGSAIVFAGRNDGSTYSANPATLANVSVTGGSITGSPANIRISGDVDLGTMSIAGIALNGSGAGIVVSGADAGEVLTLGDCDFASTLAYSVINAAAGTTVNATVAEFGGTAGSDLTVAAALAATDRIVDDVDVSGFGKVVLQANTVFVTSTSFFAPYTTAPSIARAIDSAASGDTVHVQAGTYTDPLVVTKSVSLRGANAGVPGTAERGAESSIAVTGNYAIEIGAANVSVDGFAISNTAGSAVRVMGASAGDGNVSGASIANNVISGVAIATVSGGTDVSGVINLGLNEFHTANGFSVTNNSITATGTIAGGNGAMAVRLGNTGGDLSGTVTIAGNRITGPGSGVQSSVGVFMNTDAANVSVSSNEIADFRFGSVVQGA